VAKGSQTETFAALRLGIDSWRWKGVPIYIRAGKCLPVTCTEMVVRMHRPPSIFQGPEPAWNYYRVRINPDTTIASGVNITAVDDDSLMQTEMIASHYPHKGEVEPYERVLGEAMSGDTTHFAREDFVEEAWRIVAPVLKAPPSVLEYDPMSWGPAAGSELSPPGGWQNPIVKG
jgi:glucose-6-phosphate 1-dehydrogenase